jgi:neutral ceramidase
MPQVLPVQVLKIGNLVIAGQPTEITTMAGRRVRKTLLSNFAPGEVDYAVVAGLSNTYASYLATYEEYQKQGYEGGGTMFGPYELDAFQQEYSRLCSAISDGSSVYSGPEPLDLRGYQVNFTTGVVLDDVPIGKKFGSVYENTAGEYTAGSTVSVTFRGAHPRNNLRTMNTFLTVEKVTAAGIVIVRRDCDPDTKFIWKRSGAAYSKVTITWNTTGAQPGRYVIRYYGDYKTLDGKIHPFTGVSRVFAVK